MWRLFPALLTLLMPPSASADILLIDDFSDARQAAFGGRWTWSTDQVMGGVSSGSAQIFREGGQESARIEGQVSTANNGGFIQIRLPFAEPFDASAFEGIGLRVQGNGVPYWVHLRDAQARRPWHVFRAGYDTDGSVQTITLPFEAFEGYRQGLGALDTRALISIGLVAGYDDFDADLRVYEVWLY